MQLRCAYREYSVYANYAERLSEPDTLYALCTPPSSSSAFVI